MQVIPEELPTTLINRMSGLTVGVSLSTKVVKAKNGGEILRLHILRNPNAIATTSSGLVYYRRGDNSEPISSEDLSRLAADKGCLRWEDQDSGVSMKLADEDKLEKLVATIKGSDRVSDFVKAKDTRELLEHFSLTVPDSDNLTNLGVLFIGKTAYPTVWRLGIPAVCHLVSRQTTSYTRLSSVTNTWQPYSTCFI